MPMRATSAFLPALAELRQPVGERDPLELAAGARVVHRRHPVGLVEATRGHVDLVSGAVELKGDLGAAFRAEAARALPARAKARRLAPNKTKPRARHAEPGHEGRARSAPA